MSSTSNLFSLTGHAMSKPPVSSCNELDQKQKHILQTYTANTDLISEGKMKHKIISFRRPIQQNTGFIYNCDDDMQTI